MILFSPERKDFYTHCGLGLGATPTSMELWNLLSLSCRSMFAFENGLQSDRLPAGFDRSLFNAAEHTLLQDLGGVRVMEYMRSASPWLFYKALTNYSHQHLKLDRWHRGGLQGLVRARCHVWDGATDTLSKSVILVHSKDYQK